MTDQKRRFGIGVVGAGMGAKPHALALQSLHDTVEVRGVFRRNGAERDAFCAQYGFPPASGIDALLDDPLVDALLILTPPNARDDLVLAAAKAGKHVLCEKPLERTLAAAERIVATADTAGITLGVIFQHRFRQASLYLAQAVAEGRYGRLDAVHLVVPWWRPQSYYDQPGRGSWAQDGGGVLITQAIHSLDLMLSLCGPVAAVTAMSKTTRLHQMETEDFVSAGLEFANGAVGAVMATTAGFPGGPESLALHFEHASATLTAGDLVVHLRNGQTLTEGEAGQGGGGADPMAFPFDWHRAQIADFVHAVRHGRQPLSNGHSALVVHRLIDALFRSAQEGRRVAV